MEQFNEIVSIKEEPFLPDLLNKHKEFCKSIVEKYEIKIKLDSTADGFSEGINVKPSIFIGNVKIFKLGEFSSSEFMRKSYYEIVAYFIKKYDLYKKLTEVF